MMTSAPTVAGSLATVVFASATLPMLLKAYRSRDLSSYSTGNLVLANVGNALYANYVFHLPPGPLWALHAFNVTTTGLMLYWRRRYARRPSERPPELVLVR